MKSAKKTFLLIDLLSLLVIIIVLSITTHILTNEITKDFVKSQYNEARKTDLIIKSILDSKKLEFSHFFEANDIKLNNTLNQNFSDIFQIDEDFKVTKILKKETGSGVFIGYDFTYSKAFNFFHQIPDDEIVFSAIFVTPDQTGLSIFIAKKDNDKTLVGRIGIDLINSTLKRISEYEQNTIILATKDGFIVSSTSERLPFNVLPDSDIDKYFPDKKIFYTRIQSEVLENDMIILSPANSVYLMIDMFRKYYPYLILLLILIFSFKTKMQLSYIFKPLKMFLDTVKNWDTEIKPNHNNLNLTGFYEISTLYKAFTHKSEEISKYIEQIKKNNHEIFKIKQYLKNIINSMPSMLISINNDGIIKEWNEAAVKYFGINATDALGNKLWDLLPHLSKYKESCYDSIDENKVIEYKRELLRNGEEKYMDISIFPLAENGEKSMAIRLDDITKLEKTEQILRQSQKMETIGTLAGGIAHDFNNVLGGIIGTMSLIKLKLINTADLNPIREKLLEFISIIDKCSLRASDMVNNLLTISRKQESNFVYFDLNNAIKSINKICNNTFDKSITLNFNTYPKECMVYADLNQIEQALLNICINSAHAMTFMRKANEKQGGVLNLRIDKIYSDKHFQKNHPEAKEMTTYWIISISDSGVGMEQKIINKIFDPFFTTKEKGKGTGLGLSMVYNIIQLHKGFIDLYSEQGNGTTVNIYLPIPGEEAINNTILTHDNLVKGNGTILVIDDEHLIRETYIEMLSECGYKVLSAENGLQGIEIYKNNKNHINLTILDMSMPILSGIETYKQLKAFDPQIKVLMASGFRQDERVNQAIDAGVNKFLQKPFNINNLSTIIAELLKN